MRQVRQTQPTPLSKFNKRVELQKQAEPPQQGVSGEKLKTHWLTFATVWAAVSSMIGYEKSDIAGATGGAVQTHLIKIRYTSALWQTLSPSHRVYWKDGTKERALDIKTVNNWNEIGVEIWLQCAENMA